MVEADRLLPDPKAALVERLGLRVAALLAIQCGEVDEGFRDVGVVRSQRLLADGKGALVERLGFG